MKNLENLKVVELDSSELKQIQGGGWIKWVVRVAEAAVSALLTDEETQKAFLEGGHWGSSILDNGR